MNPLLLPEIVERVSYFVPAWTRTIHKDNICSFSFTPQDLIAASLVSTTWYNWFYPQLWKIYDGKLMTFPGDSKSRPSEHFNIPWKIIVAQSSNFRIITGYYSRFREFLNCQNLVELTLYGDSPQCINFLKSSPTLKILTWHGSCYSSEVMAGLNSEYMLNLVCLEELTLECWDVAMNSLLLILKRISKVLRRLSLKNVIGFDSILESMELHDQANKGTQGIGVDEDIAQVQEPLVLDRLEELTLKFEWPENPVIVDLVTKCCPNLRDLYLDELLSGDVEMTTRFTEVLKESHPYLKRDESVRSIDGMRYYLPTGMEESYL